MSQFSLRFDRESFEALDQIALLARQDYNLGGVGDWFGEFRGGLYGFYARLYGVQVHYEDVHAWQPKVRIPADTEYHLASILFQMDSAIECFTFALNAFGWAVTPSGFRDVTEAKALRSISPIDILGDPTRAPARQPQPGYVKVFPRCQSLWQGQAPVIVQIRDLHDVSKHRQTIFVGGKARSDPPDGFYEALGIPDDARRRAPLWPMAEIILKHDPKVPAIERTSRRVEPGELLEELVPSFVSLVDASGKAAFEDATANVPLNERQFRSG
ncbi:MAG: hypothetical protein IH856_19835 [Deltaproteobacteria bacterium]|nr:hypothetical protein [Deltaproteobacteria bacterium]